MAKVYTKVYTLSVMKKLLIILAAIAISILFFRSVSATSLEPCPVGSYPIGVENDKYICKQEPTGCLYGDSIPLGPACDKHAPDKNPNSYSNPERDYFDAEGNRYDYQGNRYPDNEVTVESWGK